MRLRQQSIYCYTTLLLFDISLNFTNSIPDLFFYLFTEYLEQLKTNFVHQFFDKRIF